MQVKNLFFDSHRKYTLAFPHHILICLLENLNLTALLYFNQSIEGIFNLNPQLNNPRISGACIQNSNLIDFLEEGSRVNIKEISPSYF